jgi:hypothetical protein
MKLFSRISGVLFAALTIAPLLHAHPGGSVETRLQWPGSASLAVDAIALWKIEGAG